MNKKEQWGAHISGDRRMGRVPQEKNVQGLTTVGFHKMAYVEWSSESEEADTLLCVHGLTRNGRDFDWLAKTLTDHHVVCPDIVGRGKSDTLPHSQLYSFPQYLADLNVLLGRLNVTSVDFLGTSMGGLLGILLASLPGTPIRRLILNDVGPTVPAEALQRLYTYAQTTPFFSSFEEGRAYLKNIYKPFLSKEYPDFWDHLAHHGLKQTPQGWSPCFDNASLGALKDATVFDLWMFWERITCPILVVKGEHSDILTPEILEEMKRRKPHIETYECPGVGHAPSLAESNQITFLQQWLNRKP